MKKLLTLIIVFCNLQILVFAQEGHKCADTCKMKEPLKITLLNHNRVMTELFGEPKMEIKNIGILVYDGFYTLDAIGPMAVFSELMGTNVFCIGLKKGLD